MKFVHLIFLLFCCSDAFADSSKPIVTKLIASDIFTYDSKHLEQLAIALKSADINTITVVIAWSIIEPKPGQYEFIHYTTPLDFLTQQGFDLLLALDSSRRKIINQNQQLTGEFSAPQWLFQRYPDAIAVDFFSTQNSTQDSGLSKTQKFDYPYDFDYHDTQHLPAIDRFYNKTIQFFRQRYGDKVLAFIPGITHELEIKYGQHGYRWQSYSKKAQQGFSNLLQKRGKATTDMPVIAYSNSLVNGYPTLEPEFPELMQYREAVLKQYVCRLTDLIRQHGAIAAGYFGQPLTSHDAIYALGIIEEVVDCFDKITVDYNYYNGWKVELNPYVLPLLVNYAYNLGYSRIMAGLYLERLYAADGTLNKHYLYAITDTLKLLRNTPIVGIEIGNVAFDDLSILSTFSLPSQVGSTVSTGNIRFKIGLVASKWTFYLWHGEYSNERNIIQDALFASFRLLHHADDFDANVLGERALLTQDLSQYDALVFPHQTTLSTSAMAAVHRYAKSGGRLVQDVRLNAFAATGELNSGWEKELFGIAGLSWHNESQRFIYNNRRIILPKQPNLYFTYATMAAAPGYKVTMPLFQQTNIGLMIRGPRTLVFGFLPQLIEDKAKKDFWQQAYLDSIRALLNDN